MKCFTAYVRQRTEPIRGSGNYGAFVAAYATDPAKATEFNVDSYVETAQQTGFVVADAAVHEVVEVTRDVNG